MAKVSTLAKVRLIRCSNFTQATTARLRNTEAATPTQPQTKTRRGFRRTKRASRGTIGSALAMSASCSNSRAPVLADDPLEA